MVAPREAASSRVSDHSYSLTPSTLLLILPNTSRSPSRAASTPASIVLPACPPTLSWIGPSERLKFCGGWDDSRGGDMADEGAVVVLCEGAEVEEIGSGAEKEDPKEKAASRTIVRKLQSLDESDRATR